MCANNLQMSETVTGLPPKKKRRTLSKKLSTRRKSSRARGLNQLVIVQQIPKNGQCLYLAVLAATRDKNLEPGRSVTNASKLRKDIKDIKLLPDWMPRDMKKNVLKRIQKGIRSPNSNKKVGYDAWGSQEEISMMENKYKLDIVVVNFQENRVCNVKDFTDASRQIILAYDGEHYDWCKLPERTTVADLVKSVTKKNIYLKF